MKKFICLILALITAFSVPFSVYAAEYEIYDDMGNVIDYVTVPDETAENLSAVLVNESWIKLSWEFDDWSAYISGFEVLRYYPASNTYSHIGYTEKKEFKVKELKPATTYYYAVKAYVNYAEQNYYGEPSKPVAVSTSPKAPKLKKVKCSGTGKLIVSFKKAKKASGYMLQYSTNKKFKPGFTNSVLLGKKKKSYTVKNLGNKTYYVRIRAYREAEGKKYFGAYSDVKSTDVKKGVDLKTMINATKTDLKGRKMIKELTNGDVDIKKYKTTYDRIKALYKWHAVHGLEFEHCLACNGHFNDCLYYLYGENRKYDSFIWIDAGNFKNRNGSLSVHKWSVLYFAGIPYIFDPRLQSYTKDYNGTLYFGLEKGSALQKRYLHDFWYCYWGLYNGTDDTMVKYHK